MSALRAAKKWIDRLDERLVIVPGDGVLPRTGALFAYFTRARVISIDPLLRLRDWEKHCEVQRRIGYPPQRIRVIADRIENVTIDCENSCVLVAWVHSHADMNSLRLVNCAHRSDIALPCCVGLPPNFATVPHIVFEDKHVLSTKNTVHIWLDSPAFAQARRTTCANGKAQLPTVLCDSAIVPTCQGHCPTQ